ncbi:porin family protein [Xanthovirga aplysinae]|uniref:porin family protein n=1 Tax=Xanthovirga aplysinae TaxID=2529853 RepID=UPI0012BD3459|nr:porin family protein [Xanthovirga aplysinae]MTI29690.1 PorT family protein [Xanthovirga aplysinae]
MKRLFLLGCFGLFSLTSFAQTQFGLYLSTGLQTNRIETSGEYSGFQANKIHASFSFGPTVNFFLTENTAFNSGIYYTPKRVHLENNTEGPIREMDSRLQYLQLPLSIRFNTNEIALDTKLYFQLGGLAEVLIHEKEQSELFPKGYNWMDASLLLAAGVERKIGTTNTVFAGISYKRGLTNIVSTKNITDGNLSIKNDLISLDIGIFF